MNIKIIEAKEYQLLLNEKDSIVSELEIILAEHHLVVVKMNKDCYKVLKYPRLQSMIDGFDEEKLNTVVTKGDLQKFIFLLQL